MGAILSSLLEIFYTKKLDIVVIGLENRYDEAVLRLGSCLHFFDTTEARLARLMITVECFFGVLYLFLWLLREGSDAASVPMFLPQWKNNVAFRLGSWPTCRDCTNHWTERQSVQERKG